MGIFNWLKGGASGPPPDKTTTWIRAQIHEKSIANDALALAEACATLSNRGSMLFGMIMPATLATHDDLLEEATIALRGAVPTMPDSVCDAVFATIERASLPIDVAKRRAALEVTRRAAAEKTARWIRDQIEERTASGSFDVVAIADAAATLSRGAGMVFGMVVPPNLPDREALRDAALAAIRTRIPTITARELDALTAVSRVANLALVLDDRRAELAAEREAERETAREAAAIGEPRDEALEREIAAVFDSDDGDDAYLVYADWLQGQNHPRGTLMAMHVRGAHEAATAHLAANEAVLLGPLAAYRLVQDGSDREAFAWRRGFIDSAFLSVTWDGTGAIEEALELLLVHPSGRYLRELALGINGELDEGPLDDVFAILARAAPPTLRSLHVGAFAYPDESDMSAYLVGDLAPLWPRLAGLRRLIVQGAEFVLGDIVLPNLEHAEFRTGGLSLDAAESIARATWPKLRSLDVWYGDPNYGAEAAMADARPLLERADLALAHLGIKNATFTDEVCDALANAPIMATVTELDLSMGTLSDDGVNALIANKARWPKLHSINVSRSYLTDAGFARLVAAYPSVVGNDLQDDSPDRYVTVGE